MVFHQLANGTHTTVTKVVNIVDITTAIAQIDQRFDTLNDVFFVQGPLGVFFVQGQTHVHFHATNSREVIPLAVKEQGVKQSRRSFDGGWFTRTHHAIDIHERGVSAHVLVLRHGVAHVWPNSDVVDVQNRNFGDACVNQLLQGAACDVTVLVDLPCQLITSLNINCAGFFVDDVLGDELANDLIKGNQQVLHLAFVDKLFDRTWGHFLTGFGNHFTAIGVDQIIGRAGTADTIREEFS